MATYNGRASIFGILYWPCESGGPIMQKLFFAGAESLRTFFLKQSELKRVRFVLQTFQKYEKFHILMRTHQPLFQQMGFDTSPLIKQVLNTWVSL